MTSFPMILLDSYPCVAQRYGFFFNIYYKRQKKSKYSPIVADADVVAGWGVGTPGDVEPARRNGWTMLFKPSATTEGASAANS